jgi:HSP20 family protein
MANIETTNKTPVRRTWDPMAELRSMSQRFDDLFGGWPTLTPMTSPTSMMRSDMGMDEFLPMADLEETADAWVVDIDLAGVDKDDIDVEVEDRTLVVSGERKEKEREGVLRRKTRVTGTFRYEVRLPADVNTDQVEATLDKGELTVKLPKAKPEPTRKVLVS